MRIVVLVIMFYELSKSFGKSAGFTFGLVLPFLNPIFALILGFGDAQYRTPAGVGSQPLPPPTS